MRRRQGNSNWGKPQPAIAESVSPISFEEIATKLRLRPAQYLASQALRIGLGRIETENICRWISHAG